MGTVWMTQIIFLYKYISIEKNKIPLCLLKFKKTVIYDEVNETEMPSKQP